MTRLIFGTLLAFFRSNLLALVLLISILVSCVVGTAVLPVPVGRVVVFSSLWFNGLLVLLVLNTTFCFFRAERFRDLNPVSVGTIVFHLSFILLFAGIVYNGLFSFRGAIRLTEGETLNIADPGSYDAAEWGRFFDHAKLSGILTLNKLHTHYTADGKDKGVANDITIVDGDRRVDGVAYITNAVDHKGFKFYRNKDGFSPLIVLWDQKGKELYGAYVPLQSLPQKGAEKKYIYTTGTAGGPGSIPFPQDPASPVMNVRIEYHLPEKAEDEKRVSFRVRRDGPSHGHENNAEPAEQEAALGEKVGAGDYYLAMQEVRYWASMDVRYNPGLPVILSSFWIGFAGAALTTVARLVKK